MRSARWHSSDRFPMLLAVEDPLSEAVVRKTLATVYPQSPITLCLGLKGKGYLKTKAENLNKAARGYPVFLLTDLDDPRSCPAGLIRSWLRSPKHPNLLFRVAVMEVESWMMADRQSFAKFLSIPQERIPLDTDLIPRPKEFVVSLARLSRSSRVRDDLVPARGGTSRVGPAYNLRLASYVGRIWNPEAAATASGSLRRTLDRLKEFATIPA
jgi:hypothetical protein